MLCLILLDSFVDVELERYGDRAVREGFILRKRCRRTSGEGVVVKFVTQLQSCFSFVGNLFQVSGFLYFVLTFFSRPTHLHRFNDKKN